VAIAVLLGTISMVLIRETKSLLIGEAATPEALASIRTAVLGGKLDKLIHMRTLHLGPDELLVAGKVSFAGAPTVTEVAAEINAAEQRIRSAVPAATVIYLEPDLYRPELARDAAPGLEGER